MQIIPGYSWSLVEEKFFAFLGEIDGWRVKFLNSESISYKIVILSTLNSNVKDSLMNDLLETGSKLS